MKTSSSSFSPVVPASFARCKRWLACPSVALGTLALACQSRPVDLGGGTVSRDLERSVRCAESTRLEGNVIVTHQEELAARAGCEEIAGHLIVKLFAGADLRPLSSLRVVEGHFALGLPSYEDQPATRFFNIPPARVMEVGVQIVL